MTNSDVTLTSMQYLSYWMLKNANTNFSVYKVSKDLYKEFQRSASTTSC